MRPLTRTLSIMRIALFAAALSAAATAIPQTVQAEAPTAKVIIRNPKYFSADTLKDSFAAVVVAYDAPNASAIAEGFAAKDVPVFVVDADGVAMRWGLAVHPTQTLGEFLAAQRAPSDSTASSTSTAADSGARASGRSAPSTKAKDTAKSTTDPGMSAGELSKMPAKELREIAKSLNVPFVGKTRDDIESGIRAARAKAAETRPSAGEGSGDSGNGSNDGAGDSPVTK